MGHRTNQNAGSSPSPWQLNGPHACGAFSQEVTAVKNALESFTVAYAMDDPVDQLVLEMQRIDGTESQTGRLSRKLSENPFLGVGLLGLVGACSLGALRFHQRPMNMSASQYLMQLRVVAQGTVVGSLALGVAYKLLRRQPIRVRAEGNREEEVQVERLMQLGIV